MFDLITGQVKHVPGGGTGPVLVSSGLHLLALGAIVAVPLLLMREVLPEVPTMMAFVASAPAPPPPPPPPAAPAPKSPAQPQTPAKTPAIPAAAPIDAPAEVTPEPPAGQTEAGVSGGVEGGVPEGAVGGIVGGIPDEAPPPPPAAPTQPVRIGGQLKAPALVTRVEPTYPHVAVAARLQGVVILEATVNTEGRVTDLKVLRGLPFLDRAAIDAVMQWRYSPVMLNGTPVPFILTVTVSFSLPDPKQTAAY